MIIPLTLVDALKEDFPKASISLNPGSGTINVNGVSVVLSGFKDGVIEQFSKHDPLFKADVYGKVKALVEKSMEIVAPTVTTKEEVKVEEKKEDKKAKGKAKEATPEEEAKFLNDESSEA